MKMDESYDLFQDLRNIVRSEDPCVLWDQALHPLLINAEFRSFHALYTQHSGLEVYARMDRITNGRVQRGYYSRRVTRWSRVLNRWQPRLAFRTIEEAYEYDCSLDMDRDTIGPFYLEGLSMFRVSTEKERSAEMSRLTLAAHRARTGML